jgi:hypothetical protein
MDIFLIGWKKKSRDNGPPVIQMQNKTAVAQLSGNKDFYRICISGL